MATTSEKLQVFGAKMEELCRILEGSPKDLAAMQAALKLLVDSNGAHQTPLATDFLDITARIALSAGYDVSAGFEADQPELVEVRQLMRNYVARILVTMPDSVRARVRKTHNPLADWANAGSSLWHNVFSGHYPQDDDPAAITAIYDWSRAQDSIRRLAADDSTMLSQLVSMVRWYDCALPVVAVGHKRACAIMATKMTKEVENWLKPPWGAFCIQIPPGLLSTTDETGADSPITTIFAHRMVFPPSTSGRILHEEYMPGVYWNCFAVSNAGVDVHSLRMPIAELLEDIPISTHKSAFEVETSDKDQRVLQLAVRLALGTCIAMNDPDDLKPVGSKGHKGRSAKRQPPTFRRFRLARPVQVDAQQAVKDYIAGGGKSPTVQSLVAGHLKRQVHGEGRLLRKLIWVEPYWRGPEDAPMPLRSHVIPEPTR